jgi:hypothetical protein
MTPPTYTIRIEPLNPTPELPPCNFHPKHDASWRMVLSQSDSVFERDYYLCQPCKERVDGWRYRLDHPQA